MATRISEKLWVYDDDTYKIFDRIFVHAAHNELDTVKVNINRESNKICVYNSGNSGDEVSVEIDNEHKVGLILALLTCEDDDTGAFMEEFIIETADGKRQKKYKQVLSDNLRNKLKPEITDCDIGENWTKVTFKPDLAKFDMTALEDDIVSLMKKRVVCRLGWMSWKKRCESGARRRQGCPVFL